MSLTSIPAVLRMAIDVYSREIVGREVHAEENSKLAAELVQSAI